MKPSGLFILLYMVLMVTFTPALCEEEKDEGQSGHRHTDTFTGLLTHTDSEVRAAAAWALGKCDDENSVDVLIEVLDDESASVRSEAAMALGRIGDKQAVDALKKASEDPDPKVRQAAKDALNKIAQDEDGGVLGALKKAGKAVGKAGKAVGKATTRAAEEVTD